MLKFFVKTIAYMKPIMLLCTHNDTASVTLKQRLTL